MADFRGGIDDSWSESEEWDGFEDVLVDVMAAA